MTLDRLRWIAMPLMESQDLGGGGGGEATDLSEVISGSLEGLEGREGEAQGEVKEPTAEEKASQEEEQELQALEKEILAKNPNMKGNMAVHRHQAVLTRGRNQWATEKKTIEEAHAAKLKEYEWTQDPELKQALQALALAETDQKAFVELLLQDPRFAELIQMKAAQEAAQEKGSERPGPNKASEDGKYKYYDEEGLKALMAWERAQAVKEAQEGLRKEFGPVMERHQQQEAWQEALQTQGQVLERARKEWDGFKENEPAIREALEKNPTWDLHDAYRAVAVKAFKEGTKVNREALRKELLEEMNKKPKAASQGEKPQAAERVAKDGPRDLADVIRESIQDIR